MSSSLGQEEEEEEIRVDDINFGLMDFNIFARLNQPPVVAFPDQHPQQRLENTTSDSLGNFPLTTPAPNELNLNCSTMPVEGDDLETPGMNESSSPRRTRGSAITIKSFDSEEREANASILMQELRTYLKCILVTLICVYVMMIVQAIILMRFGNQLMNKKL